MKIGFFGTGEFSKNILESILFYSNISIDVVVSQIDKPVGRSRQIEETDVKKLSTSKKLNIIQPKKIRNNLELEEELKNLDFIVVVAYGKIIPESILSIPKYGCINIHGSILPDYRGASPIQEAIKNGDKKTGLTIMYMSKGMDEGDIIEIKEVNIDKNDRTGDIFKKFELIGPELLISNLNKIMLGKSSPIKQDEIKATYCSKISKEEGEVRFNVDSVDNIYNKFRAYYNWPGIYTYYNGKKLNIEECVLLEKTEYIDTCLKKINIGEVVKINKRTIGIICADNNILQIKEVKLEGKKTMNILDFVNGNKEFLDYKF